MSTLKRNTQAVSFLHFKGGVGKTTLTVNTAHWLGKLNYKVLIIDLDSQCNSTASVYNHDIDEIEFSVKDILKDYKNIDVNKVIIPPAKTKFDNVSLIASSRTLDDVAAAIQLKHASPNLLLKAFLTRIKDQFDFILFDCPPALATISFNALNASNVAVVPVTGGYALSSLANIFTALEQIEMSNPDIKILSPVINFYEAQNLVDQALLNEVNKIFSKQHIEEKLYSKEIILIPKTTTFKQAEMLLTSVVDLEPNSKASKSMKQIANLLINKAKEN